MRNPARTSLARAQGTLRLAPEPPSSHRHLGGVIVVLAVLAVVSLCGPTTPALGLAQRGHVFSVAFPDGGAGEKDGQLREPVGIAVDEQTGGTYVVDRGNNRIDEFGPAGEFLAAWGWGVSDGGKTYEVCKSRCQAGSGGELRFASAIAVDNSTSTTDPSRGDVYVITDDRDGHSVLEKFAANGEREGRLKQEGEEPWEGALDGVAVDSTGTLWVYRGEEEAGYVERFSDATRNSYEGAYEAPEGFECPKPGFGVNGAGSQLWLAHELKNAEGECPEIVRQSEREEGVKTPHEPLRPVVIGDVDLTETTLEARAAELTRMNTASLAVDESSGPGTPLGEDASGDVYLAEGQAVAAYDQSGESIESFGAEPPLKEASAVAVDSKTGDVLVADAGEDQVDVFAPQPARKPTVDTISAQNVALGEVQLTAQVDPGGADTHVYFRYGTVDCVSDPGGCTDVPAPPGVDIGQGYGDVQVPPVTLKGLQPSTTYYYRIIATSALPGGAEGENKLGTITTPPSPAGVLADGRAWEPVSPPENAGVGIEALRKEGAPIQAAADGNAIAYVANAPIGTPQSSRAPETTQILSSRAPDGWSSQDVMTPHTQSEGFEPGLPSEYRAFSSNLSLSLVEPPLDAKEPTEAPPLAPNSTEKTLYVRDDPPLTPAAAENEAYQEALADSSFLAPGYLPLVTPATETAQSNPGERTRFGGQLDFLDATPDLSHVVFNAEVPLLNQSSAGLYEWAADGTLQLVSVLPGSEGAAYEPQLGLEGTDVRGAVSENGSRIFFSSEGPSGEYHRLYMRDTTKNETLQINAAQGVIEPVAEESQVAFQAANSDGSRVYFTDTAPLTANSRQQPAFAAQENPTDLYECAIVERAGKLACNLTDITATAGSGSADVLNVIPGIGEANADESEAGTYVYFIANGVLAPGAKQGDCAHYLGQTPPEATCNLYLFHDGMTTFIAALSNEDSGDWGSLRGSGKGSNPAAPRPDLADVTSSVAKNGRYIAFMSDEPLTGYDNVDASSEATGARDEEVYIYDASTRLLVCASCNSRGPSVGMHDVEHTSEGEGLLVDRREDWLGSYLAGSVPGWDPIGDDNALHQPRYLSTNGRLFFNSPDNLVTQASAGTEAVYEYEPAGVGTCTQQPGCVSLISSGTSIQESTFLDASENGNDAFFLTSQPLTSSDQDTNAHIYDAHVCTEASPCSTVENESKRSCETASSCNPTSPTPPPTTSPPPSATFVGPGVPASSGVLGTKAGQPPKPKPKALTRAQRLMLALKNCHKDKSKTKRKRCEREARARYGTPAKPKKAARPRRKP